MRNVLMIAAACAALIALAMTPRIAYQSRVLTILYSGDTYGQLESCG